MRAAVFRRDGWRCRYCGRRLVVSGVLELIGILYPEEFPFPSHNMAHSSTHPAAIRVYPNVDHVDARAESVGDDLRNLIGACTPCNELKSDNLGWVAVEQDLDQWDGLTNSYRPLLQLVGVPVPPFHRQWMRALGL